MRAVCLFVVAAALTLLAGCATAPLQTVAPAAAADAYDLVIRGGEVIDGTGRTAFRADVAIQEGRIVMVGAVSGRGRTEIDAAGKVVAPGFIDVHTHSENIAELPQGENFIRMGVTTIISGNCGSSNVDVAEYFDKVTRTGVALNVGTLLGQGTVRARVMGGSFMRPATASELEQMRRLVERGMREGALGISTGLIYLPGTFTKTEELIELAKVAAAHGGIYVSHMRNEGTSILASLEELARIAREARIRAEVSHIKLGGGPTAWGRADEVVAWLNKARAAGLDITQDQYVYTASSTGIETLVPSDAREGGTKQFMERLRDPAQKEKIVAQMKEALRRARRDDYTYAVIANYRPDPRLNGKTVSEAAKLVRKSDSLDAQIEVVLEIVAQGGGQGVFHSMHEDDLRKFLAHPHTMFASDSGPRRYREGVPHPRGYGNNARVLGRYVRELKLLPLEEAVRKMTSLPAQTFRLQHRGELKPGFIADVVVFDPDRVADVATFADPHHYAVGFSDVLVNGVPVIRAGALTAARPGRPVRLTDPAPAVISGL